MKKITTKWVFVIMAFFMLTSCDKDQEMAYYLDGIWHGTIRDSRDMYDVTMEFIQSGMFSSSGYGYEKDCSWSGHVSRVRFDWTVGNRNIYLRYSDGTRFVMECDYFPKYARTGENFRGRIYDERSKADVADFILTKIYLHDDRSNKQDSTVVVDKNNVEFNQEEVK